MLRALLDITERELQNIMKKYHIIPYPANVENM
jgi:hypothetical protein